MECSSVEFGDEKLDKSYSLKYEQRSRHRSIRESTQKKSRKIWWNETKGFIFAPRNLRETAGRKKEKNARMERVNNKFLYRRKSDLCKIYMYTRCSTERIESTVNDTIRKGHL